MRNQKLDQICAKRLKSPNFAQAKYQPLLTRAELITAIAMVSVTAIAIGYMALKTYFAG